LIACFAENVVALERRTGRVAWHWTHKGQYAPRLLLPPGRVICAQNLEVVCLAYETGAVLWQATAPCGTDTILMDGDLIFIGEAGEAACLDLNTGAVLWHQGFKGMGQARIALGVPGTVAQSDAS
jgi:outer membrane protein assembly factor BamB